MHRNSPTAMQSSQNFPGVTLLPYGRGGERRQRGGRGITVARFLTIKNRRALGPDAELYRVRELLINSLPLMVLFKRLVCMSPTRTELSVMHRSLVTLLQCSCHMRINLLILAYTSSSLY
jgi:hypothetical protein